MQEVHEPPFKHRVINTPQGVMFATISSGNTKAGRNMNRAEVVCTGNAL